MSASIDEYRQRPRPSALPEARVSELKLMAQDVVRASALTGYPEWDWYLRYIEASIKAAERHAAMKRDQAASLVLVDEAKAKEAAVLCAAATARAEALKEAILLPKWIIENGEAAAKKIAELEASV